MLMSSGQRSPECRIVRMAPMAISSDSAKTAVGGFGNESRLAMAASPPAKVKAPSASYPSGTGRPASAMAPR